MFQFHAQHQIRGNDIFSTKLTTQSGMEVLLTNKIKVFLRQGSRRRIYFEPFAISSSEGVRRNCRIEVGDVPVQMGHDGMSFVSDAEQTYDCIVTTKVRSTFAQNMRGTICIGVCIEIDLLED